MKKTFGDYTYLAGGAAKGSLWAGPDHVLYVEAVGLILPFKEQYRRIDFKNIHALTYGRTRTGLWMTIWMLLLVGLMGLGVVMNLGSSPTASVVFASVGVPLLILLIVHLAKGPTCVCKLQTAVQVLRLKPLGRLRRAESCVAQLSELCTRHQGGVAVSLHEGSGEQPNASQVRMAGNIAKPPFPGSKLVVWGLVTMLVGSAASLADLFIQSIAFFTFAGLLPVLGGVLSLAGLARSMMRYRVPGVLLTALWGEVATVALAFVVAYALFGYVMVKDGGVGSSSRGALSGVTMMLDVIRYLSNATFQSEPLVAWVNVGIAALGTFFALLGLPTALRPPMARAAAASVPQVPSPPTPPDQP